MKVPYHEQINPYSCGPAVFQMVFGYFGTRASQKTLAKELKTTKKIGTKNRDLVRVANENGFFSFAQRYATVSKIKRFLSRGLPVIVDFIEPSEEEGHYAVIVGRDRSNFIFNDPWNGRGMKMNEKDFLKRWRDGNGMCHRWLLVLSKKKFSSRKKHLPR